MDEAKVSGRLRLIIAGFVINLCLGTIYAWSVFRKPIESSPYSLTQAESALPFSVFLLSFGVSFAFSGRIIGQVGPMRPAMIGAAFSGSVISHATVSPSFLNRPYGSQYLLLVSSLGQVAVFVQPINSYCWTIVC